MQVIRVRPTCLPSSGAVEVWWSGAGSNRRPFVLSDNWIIAVQATNDDGSLSLLDVEGLAPNCTASAYPVDKGYYDNWSTFSRCQCQSWCWFLCQCLGTSGVKAGGAADAAPGRCRRALTPTDVQSPCSGRMPATALVSIMIRVNHGRHSEAAVRNGIGSLSNRKLYFFFTVSVHFSGVWIVYWPR
jgi:hypothetical protein